MPLHSRVKLGMALTSGGAVAVGTPVALHYVQGPNNPSIELNEQTNENELTQVSETGGEQKRETQPQTPQLRTKRDLGRREEASASSEQQEETLRRRDENNKKFNEFWTKLTDGYRQHQRNNPNQINNQLTFQSELRNILLQNDNLGGEWKLEKEEYRDCSRITGGQTDYCGFLKLKIGSTEYRFKLDRYENSRQNNKWGVSVVKKEEKSRDIQYYSKNTKKWTKSRAQNIDQFQGGNNSQHNWWITLDHKSIEV